MRRKAYDVSKEKEKRKKSKNNKNVNKNTERSMCNAIKYIQKHNTYRE